MGREQISSLTWSSGVGQALWGTQTASFLSTNDYINNLHVDANARPQGIFCCAKARGLGTHFGAKAPGCPGGGMVTGQIDTCITYSRRIHSTGVNSRD